MRSAASLGDVPSATHATALTRTESREPSWHQGERVRMGSTPCPTPPRPSWGVQQRLNPLHPLLCPPPEPLYLREAAGAGVGNAGGRAPRGAQQPGQEAAQPLGAQPPVAGVPGQPGSPQQPPAEHVAARRVHAAAHGHGDAHRQRPGGEQRPLACGGGEGTGDIARVKRPRPARPPPHLNRAAGAKGAGRCCWPRGSVLWSCPTSPRGRGGAGGWRR